MDPGHVRIPRARDHGRIISGTRRVGKQLAAGSLPTAPAREMKARDVPDVTRVAFTGGVGRSLPRLPPRPTPVLRPHGPLPGRRPCGTGRVVGLGPLRVLATVSFSSVSPLAHALSFHKRVVGVMPKVTRTPQVTGSGLKVTVVRLRACPLTHLQRTVSVTTLQTPEGLQRLLWFYACCGIRG